MLQRTLERSVLYQLYVKYKEQFLNNASIIYVCKTAGEVEIKSRYGIISIRPVLGGAPLDNTTLFYVTLRNTESTLFTHVIIILNLWYFVISNYFMNVYNIISEINQILFFFNNTHTNITKRKSLLFVWKR